MNCCNCGKLLIEWSYQCKSCGCELCGSCIGDGDTCEDCLRELGDDDDDWNDSEEPLDMGVR